MNDEGYGQLQPRDTTSEFNRVAFVVRQIVAQLRTMTPVQVKAVHSDGGVAAAGTVDVQPLISMVDGQNNATPHGTINGVPYFRLQGGRNAVVVDPEVDDVGFMVVSDRDMSALKSSRKASTPGSLRTFNLADGVYVGGVLNGSAEQYVMFSADGVKIADKNGNTLEMKAGEVVLTTAKLRVVGSIEATGEVTALAGAGFVTLALHEHAANNTPPTPGT